VAAENCNKFYRIQLLVSADGTKYQTWTRWGRVGERGRSAHLGDGSVDSAQRSFEKKFRDKSGLAWKERLNHPKAHKYTFIERKYEEDDNSEAGVTGAGKKPSENIESRLPKAVQNLVSFIFNREIFQSTMAQISYDAKTLPLGKLSDKTLQMGFAALQELTELEGTPELAGSRYGMQLETAMEQLSNSYFSIIPHVFGRKSPPVLNDRASIKKEVELLETLRDMKDTNNILRKAGRVKNLNPIDRQYNDLGLKELTPLDHESEEFRELKMYLEGSRGSTHHLKYQVSHVTVLLYHLLSMNRSWISSVSNERGSGRALNPRALQNSEGATVVCFGTALEVPTTVAFSAKVSVLRLAKPLLPDICSERVSTLPICPASPPTTAVLRIVGAKVYSS
jgi:poly [ADP-ribose] polymerase